MSNRTVQLNSLTPGTEFMIRGKLSFSRITSQIAGEELARRIESAKRNGMIPVERPHTTASITNAQVVYKDANNKTPEEIYAEESLWQSSSHPERGYCYTAYNKGSYLPRVGTLAGDGMTVNEIVPENELANGLDVTFVIRVFKPKTQRNNGTSLEGIIVNEPIRYYDGNAMASALSGHGLTWNSDNSTRRPATPAAPDVQNQPYGNYGNQPVQNPYQTPYGQQPQPVPQPQGNPFSAQPQTAAPYQNPAPAPSPAPAPAAPNYETFEPSGQAAPAPAQNPAPNQGGIRYDGSDRQY